MVKNYMLWWNKNTSIFLKPLEHCFFNPSYPSDFVGDYVLTTTYLINRFPSALLQNKSPFELLYGYPPSYTQIRVFGCLCYHIVPKCDRTKFQPRATTCIFLGYPSKKGYKLLHLSTQQILVSRDVIFYGHIFPFDETTMSNTKPPSNAPHTFSDPSLSKYPSSS